MPRKGQYTPIVERILRLTNKNGPIPEARPDLGPCWLFTGHLTRDGYGFIKRGGGDSGRTLAHVPMHDSMKGVPPAGYERDHLCRVRNCVNPDHLEAVPDTVNNARSSSPSAVNALKTHCKNGHAFTPENTRITVNGTRQCRICRSADRRMRTVLRNPNAGSAMALRTHCPRGHEYTPENTHIYNGSRFCRACNKIFRDRARKSK